MKKIFLFGIAILGLCLITGCTKSTVNEGEQGRIDDVVSNDKGEDKDVELKDSKKNEEKEKIDELLPYEEEDIFTHFKFRYPKNFGTPMQYSVDYVCMRNNEERSNDAKLVLAQYYVDRSDKTDLEFCDIDAIKTPKDILENFYYKIELTLSTIEKVDRAEVEYEEVKVINGIEMYKFSGTLHSFIELGDEREDYTYGIVGYSFFGKNRPFMLYAYDASVNQDQMEELTEIIDAMALSFQDEPELTQ